MSVLLLLLYNKQRWKQFWQDNDFVIDSCEEQTRQTPLKIWRAGLEILV